MRLTVVGDSTAAGCGVDTHDDGFAGNLARALSQRSGRSVRWHVHGVPGAVIRDVRRHLLTEVGGDLDLVVLLVGVNDVLARTPARVWGHELTAVVAQLAIRSRRVAVAGIAPFERFPSLPTTLAHYLRERALVLDDVAGSVCCEHPSAQWTGASDGVDIDADFFARDGFHPSAAGYGRWARAVADQLHL